MFYDLIHKRYAGLRFCEPIAEPESFDKPLKAKAMQKQVKNELKQEVVCTKAMLALKFQQEINKLQTKRANKNELEERHARIFEIRQAKKKEKQRGH